MARAGRCLAGRNNHYEEPELEAGGWFVCAAHDCLGEQERWGLGVADVSQIISPEQ